MPTKLTDAWVRNTTKPGTTWDLLASGLGLKVTPKGRKVWLMQAVWPGQATQSRRTLGQWPTMNVDHARSLAQQWREAVRGGVDPKLAERQQHEAAARAAANTFTKVAEAYIATRRNRRAKKDAEAIRRHLVKAWGDMPVSGITPRDVRTFIGELAKRAPYSAGEAWKHAVLIFKWAVHEELITTSPCASLDKRLTLNATLDPRTRVLTDEEVAALWRIADRLGYPEGHFYKMLILTACRLREVSDAKWSEFDLDRKVWSVPAERFKANQVHVVPLTDAMLKVLATIPRRSQFVFTNNGKVPINGWPKLKRKVDVRMLRTLKAKARKRGESASTVTLPHWINHDIRRTVRTNLAALGLADHIAEMVLGHGRKGIQRVYDQHKYLSEIRAALEAWSQQLVGIVCS